MSNEEFDILIEKMRQINKATELLDSKKKEDWVKIVAYFKELMELSRQLKVDV